MINAVSVHISGKSSCLVAVPLATQQLSASMDTGMAGRGRSRCELTWLARLLAKHTTDAMKGDGSWINEGAACGGAFENKDVLHKYDLEEIGGELVYVKACRSIRVAYCVVVLTVKGEQEIAHIYCAMGLDKQHHFQQVILGRFKKFW